MKSDPFNEGDADVVFRKLVQTVTQEIQSLDNEYVLKASQTELEDYYIKKVIIQPLVLYDDRCYIENQAGTQIDISHDFLRTVFPGERPIVQGTRLDVAVPYQGDPELWRIRPSTYNLSGYPEIDVRDDVIVFTIQFTDDSADHHKLKEEITGQIRSLAGAVQNLNHNVEDHNNSAPQIIRTAIQKKRRLAASVLKEIAALGIPMRRRDVPPIFAIPMKRRESPVRPPMVLTEAYRPEPFVAESEYQHILEIMRSMSLVIERNPETFASLHEEDIRTLFLIPLNSHYEGNATAETFNASGKTDIIIKVDNRIVFIAECKFWNGEKAFNEAVDQLMGYLSWRDTKCALLVFNKSKHSSSVRQKMHQVMEARPEHQRTVSYDPDSDARYIFVKESDPGREIIISTQLYDIPISQKSEKDET